MVSSSFCYDQRAVRVVFGEGQLDHLGEEVTRLEGSRALVVTTPGRAALLPPHFAPWCSGIFDGATMHVPMPVVQAALQMAEQTDADCYVAFGGGSAIGLGKALARETGRPLLAVPTTYSGSEMTAIWGLTDRGHKQTGRDPRVAPRTVLYDPALTLTLPPAVSGPSGMNAIAHGVEALYAVDATPITSLLAEEAIRLLALHLPRINVDSTNLDARAGALYGAHLAGRALDGTSMALHHKLCHTLGGTFGLPHALTHAVVLPYATAYNRPAAPEALHRLARALGADDAVSGLFALNDRLGVPASLLALGFQENSLNQAVELALQKHYPNPRPLHRDALRALLADALHGRRAPLDWA